MLGIYPFIQRRKQMDDNLNKLIALALEEDLGTGDITSEALIDVNLRATAKIEAKQDLILTGMKAAEGVFTALDKNIMWTAEKKDGDRCTCGDTIATVEGRARALPAGERTALNFLQHLSGIATLTRKFVDETEDTKAEILDTRKTLPGFRKLEKHAVKMGGGENHRRGLYDQVLIKNNHITAAGSITDVLKNIKEKCALGRTVGIETRTLGDVKEALTGHPDVIMLDNMSVDDVKEAVKTVAGRVKLEVSGNMTLDKIKAYAKTGVDYISVGSITHSAPAADIHMLIEQS